MTSKMTFVGVSALLAGVALLGSSQIVLGGLGFGLTFISMGLFTLGFIVLGAKLQKRNVKEIEHPSIPEWKEQNERPVLATPVSMIQMFTRFGYLVLTPSQILFMSRKGKRIFSANLRDVKVGVDSGPKRFVYGDRLVVTYSDQAKRERTKKFSFVRSWGTTATVGLPVDATRSARILYDALNSGSTVSGWIAAVEREKGQANLV